MGKITLHDKILMAYAKGEPMPLKGKTRITLTDVNTGEVQVTESENMVTNAVASILNNNWCGLANYSSMMPLKNLFSGVLCFTDPITENADNYNPPNSSTNDMVACAGDIVHQTANTYRGNPNEGEMVITDTSIKFVWDWLTNQGNGGISCVCLVPNTLGNMGLKPFDNTLSVLSSIGTKNISTSAVDTKKTPFNMNADGTGCVCVQISGTTFTESTVVHDFLKYGILRSVDDWVEGTSRTATIRSGNNRFIFDDDDYYYVCHASSATALQIDKIDKEDMTVTTADITYSGISLWTGTVTNYGATNSRAFAFDGTYLYYPNSAGNNFYRLNITQSSDVELLTVKNTVGGTITIDKGQLAVQSSNGEIWHNPIVISDGLILGSNYLINDTDVYEIKRPVQLGCAADYFSFNIFSWFIRNGASAYVSTQQSYGTRNVGQANVLCKMFLSTINNLQQPVTKSSSQVMKIEYELTEV